MLTQPAGYPSTGRISDNRPDFRQPAGYQKPAGYPTTGRISDKFNFRFIASPYRFQPRSVFKPEQDSFGQFRAETLGVHLCKLKTLILKKCKKKSAIYDIFDKWKARTKIGGKAL